MQIKLIKINSLKQDFLIADFNHFALNQYTLLQVHFNIIIAANTCWNTVQKVCRRSVITGTYKKELIFRYLWHSGLFVFFKLFDFNIFF